MQNRAVAIALVLAAAPVLSEALTVLGAQRQPLYDGKVESDSKFGYSAQDDKPGRAPGYRNAWEDCGATDKAGLKPGPGSAVVYPGPEIPAAARAGLSKAAETLAKYPAETKPPLDEYAAGWYRAAAAAM